MNITVYCGASVGNHQVYQEKAQELAKWMAQNNHTLIYGGGNVGLMGVMADTILNDGGQAIGVMPSFLKEREIAHNRLTDLFLVENMTERKLKMIRLADAFIALPGGPGTLEKISEVISWARIGQNNKPCILYNIAGYYNHLSYLFDHMVSEGFLNQADRDQIMIDNSLSQMENFISNYRPPKIRTY